MWRYTRFISLRVLFQQGAILSFRFGLQFPPLPGAVGHDHQIFGQAVLILDEIRQKSFGMESQLAKYFLRRLLAGGHARPNLFETALSGYRENFVRQSPAQPPAPIGTRHAHPDLAHMADPRRLVRVENTVADHPLVLERDHAKDVASLHPLHPAFDGLLVVNVHQPVSYTHLTLPTK